MLHHLPAIDPESGQLNVVIETPKGCRNKYKYDEKRGLFELSGLLPSGAVFPFDFGFLPSTLGEDGDPLDVLLLMDEPAFPGCLVRSRLIGAIEAKQTERSGTTQRNDRLIAVPEKSLEHQQVRSLRDLPANVLKEIEHFFVSYNQLKGKMFKPLHRRGPREAHKLVKQGVAEFERGQAS